MNTQRLDALLDDLSIDYRWADGMLLVNGAPDGELITCLSEDEFVAMSEDEFRQQLDDDRGES